MGSESFCARHSRFAVNAATAVRSHSRVGLGYGRSRLPKPAWQSLGDLSKSLGLTNTNGYGTQFLVYFANGESRKSSGGGSESLRRYCSWRRGR